MAGASVEVLGPLEIAVAVGPDVRARADLEPLLAVCRDAPDLCAAGVDTQIELLRSALELGGGPAPIDASAVRAVIKPREYLDELRVAMREDGVPENELEASLPVHRPFIGDLVTVYVQDLPSSMAMLMPESSRSAD